MRDAKGLARHDAPESGGVPGAVDRFRWLADTNVVGILIADAAGAVFEANDYYLRLIGCSRDDLEHGRVDWRAATPPEWLPVDEHALRELREGGTCTPYEKEYLLRDGTRVSVVLAAALRPGAAGQIVAVALETTGRRKAEQDSRQLVAELDSSRQILLSVIEDQKRAEAELHRLNAELEQRVLNRTAELSSANEELDSFAYAVSHDLRAPLRAMNGFSLAMLEDCGDHLPQEARDHLRHIRQASQTMGELIEGLLVLSRSTRGDVSRTRVDLSAIASRLCTELARADPAREVAWYVESGLAAWCDGRMMEVVLRNLLGNAWKYTGRCAAPTVRVYAETEGARRFYCVADNGAGFDIRHVERLFKPFQRVHRQDEFPGIGIGLATVKRVVDRHGGTVSASGAVGAGAVFRFSLAADPGTVEGAR